MIPVKPRTTPDMPWPDRTRPLCAYPTVATYKGRGSIEDTGSFDCK
jgi:feruloyl esterase